MVGVPRSKGCVTCIARHVKCDELRPVCTQCGRKNRKCSYNRPSKFVFFAQESKKPEHILGPQPTSNEVDQASQETVYIRSSPGVRLHSPLLELTQTLSLFIGTISPRPVKIPDVPLFTTWLSYVPEYLGKSSALDNAVSCLSLYSLANSTDDTRLMHQSFNYYGRALLHLQRLLQNQETALSSETLCATMILSVYELFSSSDQTSWIKHAGGAGQLINARGPTRYSNRFDRAMFNVSRGVIFLRDLATETPCFLEKLEWASINMIPEDYHNASSEMIAVENEFFHVCSCIPGLLHEKNKVVEANAHPESLITWFLELEASINQAVTTLTTILPGPELVPTAYPNDHLYPLVYTYENNSLASIHVHYAAMQILVYQALDQLRQLQTSSPIDEAALTPEEKYDELVDLICQSVQFALASGAVGFFYIVAGLKFAYVVARGAQRRTWIADCLGRIGAVMAVAKTVEESPHVTVTNNTQAETDRYSPQELPDQRSSVGKDSELVKADIR